MSSSWNPDQSWMLQYWYFKVRKLLEEVGCKKTKLHLSEMFEIFLCPAADGLRILGIGASWIFILEPLFGTDARERNRRQGEDRSQVVLHHSLWCTHTHTVLVAAGGGNLSVHLLQATGRDAQQHGSSVISMWCRCSEVNLPSFHFYHNHDWYVQNLVNTDLFNVH